MGNKNFFIVYIKSKLTVGPLVVDIDILGAFKVEHGAKEKSVSIN